MQVYTMTFTFLREFFCFIFNYKQNIRLWLVICLYVVLLERELRKNKYFKSEQNYSIHLYRQIFQL